MFIIKSFLRVFFIVAWMAMVFLLSPTLLEPVSAQEILVPDIVETVVEIDGEEASLTEATVEATLAATIVDPAAKQSIEEKKNADITEVTSVKNDILASYLLEQPREDLHWYNFLRQAITTAVNRGLPSNIIVLLLLFPLVATIIAFSRHVIGLRGYGIYTPAVLSVVFVSTGFSLGLVMFLLIITVSLILHRLFRKVKISYLPKTALIMWGVSALIIAFLLLMAYWRVEAFYALTIFPLLILVSLAENFTSTKAMSSTRAAVILTLETLFLAIMASLIIGNTWIQMFTILNPELVLLFSLVANILIGRYTGLRLLELFRFRDLIKKK